MSGYAYAGMAALQLAGGYFASKNIKDTARLNRDIAEMNAQFAELDAYDARLEGQTQKAKYQSVVDKTLGEQQLAMTAAGVDTTYGSAAEIQQETRFIAELNKMEIEKQAEEQALGYTREIRKTRFNSFLQYGEARKKASGVMFESLMGASKSGISAAYAFKSGADKSGADNPGADKTGISGY